MSEIDEFQDFLINELKESGYTDETEGKSVESLKEALSFQKKLNALKASKKTPPKPKPKIGAIDMSRENALHFSEDIVEFFLKENAAFDKRIIDDERYKLNVHVTTTEKPYLTMVLRDKEGRCT